MFELNVSDINCYIKANILAVNIQHFILNLFVIFSVLCTSKFVTLGLFFTLSLFDKKKNV